MLKFRVVEKTPTLGKYKGQKVQQAQQVLSGNVSFRQLCERLSKDTTVGQADIRAVLYQLADVVSEYMDLGMSVDCGELGKFRPTFGSKQVPVGEEFRAIDIKKPRITFVPRSLFKEFQYRASFERVSLKCDDKGTCSAGGGSDPSSSGGSGSSSDPLGPNKKHTGL